MKKLSVLYTLLLCLSIPALSQTTDNKDIEKKELEKLLEERKAKFDSYSESLEKHSGIFGNKTKNDIKNSNQVLINIVQTDNRIISKLYNVLDLGGFQKVTMSYDIKSREEKLASLVLATDTLSKQLETLKSSNHALQSRTLRLQWLLCILSFVALWFLYRLRRIKNQQVTS